MIFGSFLEYIYCGFARPMLQLYMEAGGTVYSETAYFFHNNAILTGGRNMIAESGTLRLDERQQEIISFYSPEFQYHNPEAVLTRQRTVRWHWHPALEFVHVLEGDALFSLPHIEVIVPEGAILILNSEVSHSACALDSDVPAYYHTHMISAELLAGGVGSFIKTKFFDPIMRCSELPYHLITKDMPIHAEACRLFEEAFHAADDKDYLMELKIRQNLTQLWLIFIEATRETWENYTPKNDYRSERIKLMLAFIQQNCTEKLTLEQIAASAGISTRECLRCFQTMLKTTPIEYLNECRVRRAADILQSGKSNMTEIALECGFSSASYFCRMFKKITGQSPTRYRNTYPR